MKVLILGVNGFIGSHLSRRILETTDWSVFGMDLSDDRVRDLVSEPRFHFIEGDIGISREWIEYHVRKCDVVLPLVAIANPSEYVRRPLAVFELDFEENLRIIRQCIQYRKRVVHPSTSEVYGMCADALFDEETSPLVLGPIWAERWIYAASKQLLDRVIYASRDAPGFLFTIVRPFNWIGPKLDRIDVPKEGSSRVVTQFIGCLLRGKPISIVDGGRQRRAFTHVEDGVDCLMRIIGDRDGRTNGQIFNIGNPQNECSIADLAVLLRRLWREHPDYTGVDPGSVDVSSEEFYGKGYQDIVHRAPSIRRAREVLGWEPRHDLESTLRDTLDAFIQEEKERQDAQVPSLVAPRPDGAAAASGSIGPG